MTAAQLARELGISRALLFKIRRRYPKGEYPTTFADLEAWRTFIAKARTDIRVSTSLPKPAGNGKLPSATESNVRFVHARAREKAASAELRELQLLATKRRLVHTEEVQLLFGYLAAIASAKLLRLRNDLPAALTGLSPSQIDGILREKFQEALSDLVIPGEFFEPRSVI
jgi:hypothetical protein